MVNLPLGKYEPYEHPVAVELIGMLGDSDEHGVNFLDDSEDFGWIFSFAAISEEKIKKVINKLKIIVGKEGTIRVCGYY